MWLLNPYRFGDPDAAAYIAAVEAADGQVLEAAVASAITAFVVGCKTDGIWTALKASCIMAGARTLAGALVPLRGAAPTNNGFVGIGTDYVRKTGLVGNGTSKYLNGNRNNNADPLNSKHLSVWRSSAPAAAGYLLGTASTNGWSRLYIGYGNFYSRINSNSELVQSQTGLPATGLYGASRSASDLVSIRIGNQNFTSSAVSIGPSNQNLNVFASSAPAEYSDARLAFYSIGEAIDLALLDARLTTLMNALAAAIP